ncbi:hypothetical protein [Streptomyces bluensis]
MAEMALRHRRPVVMLTSDIDDMAKLCGDRVRLLSVQLKLCSVVRCPA